jgi:hypothetical protein
MQTRKVLILEVMAEVHRMTSHLLYLSHRY